MNKYDLEHAVTAHPKMSKAEWEAIYHEAWELYYSPAHMETIMRRAAAVGTSPGKALFLLIWFWAAVKWKKSIRCRGAICAAASAATAVPGCRWKIRCCFIRASSRPMASTTSASADWR